MLRIMFSAFKALLLLMVAGCTFTHKLSVEPKTDFLPKVTKSPVYAGIYYSPQFLSQEQTRMAGPHIYVAPIGSASARLFDNLFPRVFEKTTRISNVSLAELKEKGVEVAVAPAFEHFDFMVGLDADSDRYSVLYRLTLYTKLGVPVASWVVPGNKASHAFGIGGLIEDDLTDAAVNFLTTFHQEADPALSAIANREKREVVSIDPQNLDISAGFGKFPGLDLQQEFSLRESGIVVINVEAESLTDRSLVVHSSSMRLQLKDGQLIEPLTVSSALGELEQTTQTGGVVAALIGAPFGLLADYVEQQSKQSERELQYRSGTHALFEDRKLQKGNKESGIVLFRLPDKATSLEGARLLLWAIDPEVAEGLQLDVSISAEQ